MRFELTLWSFSFFACTKHYDVAIDDWKSARICVRIGKRVWSTLKGYRVI